MIYNQRDTKWGSEKLGFGVGTIHNFGCKITALAQGLLRFGHNYNPSTINTLLKQYNLYTGTTKNLMDDANIHKLPFIESFRRVNAFTMNELEELLKTHVVIGEVSPIPIGGTGQHFVGVDSRDGVHAVVTDSWFGDKKRVVERYGKYGNLMSLRVYKVVRGTSGMITQEEYDKVRLARDEHYNTTVAQAKEIVLLKEEINKLSQDYEKEKRANFELTGRYNRLAEQLDECRAVGGSVSISPSVKVADAEWVINGVTVDSNGLVTANYRKK